MKKLKRQRYWLRYGIIGLVIGIINNIASIAVAYNESFLYPLFTFPYYIFCRVFNLGAGEPCGWAALFWIPIIYLIIGILIGILKTYLKSIK